MNKQTTTPEKTGLLEVVGGIKTKSEGLAIRAGLEDLPGIQAISFVGAAVKITYDPQLVSMAQIYEAATIVGFNPRQFHLL